MKKKEAKTNQAFTNNVNIQKNCIARAGLMRDASQILQCLYSVNSELKLCLDTLQGLGHSHSMTLINGPNWWLIYFGATNGVLCPTVCIHLYTRHY